MDCKSLTFRHEPCKVTSKAQSLDEKQKLCQKLAHYDLTEMDVYSLQQL